MFHLFMMDKTIQMWCLLLLLFSKASNETTCRKKAQIKKSFDMLNFRIHMITKNYLKLWKITFVLISTLIWFVKKMLSVPYLYKCIMKSVNLQYNTLVRWADGTNNLSTKCLMFQVLFFFHKILQNSLQKPFQFIFL